METQHLPTTGHQFAARKRQFLLEYSAQKPPQSFRHAVPDPTVRLDVYRALHLRNPQQALQQLQLCEHIRWKIISTLL